MLLRKCDMENVAISTAVTPNPEKAMIFFRSFRFIYVIMQ
jgi:hypothetical protein